MTTYPYKKKVSSLAIGSGLSSFELSIECLENLEGTIDDLFEHFSKQGKPELLESFCPYFGVIWPAAQGLSEYLAAMGREGLEGKRILEIGCGLAIPSFVASHFGAVVTASDSHPDVPVFLRRNLQLNPKIPVEYMELDWSHAPDDFGGFDLVIGSDILYEKQFPESVARALKKLVKPNGTLLIADPGRPYIQSFADEMVKIGFQSEILIKKVSATQDVFVLKFNLPK